MRPNLILKNVMAVVLLSAMLVLASCEIYHFEYPLPVDSKGLYTFPASLQGLWYEENEPRYLIDKNSLTFFGNKKITKVYSGVLDSLSAKKGKNGLRHIVTMKGHKIDTLLDYVVKKGKIYEVDSDDKLHIGRRFNLVNDTIYFETPDKGKIYLDKENFLRKISANSYAFNLIEGNFLARLSQDQGLWYQIGILKKTKDGKLLLGQVNSGPDSITVFNKKGDYYLSCEWTKLQLAQSIENKLFKFDTLLKKGDKRLEALLARKKAELTP